MTWRWGHGRAAIVSGLLLLTSLACSSSDPIQSGNVNLPVVASTAPAYSGSYQWARLQLDQITLRPTDAQANAYLQIPLGLLFAVAASAVGREELFDRGIERRLRIGGNDSIPGSGK